MIGVVCGSQAINVMGCIDVLQFGAYEDVINAAAQESSALEKNVGSLGDCPLGASIGCSCALATYSLCSASC